MSTSNEYTSNPADDPHWDDLHADDLLWAAFCYASDELTPEAAEAFEERLATEQGAREALAQAVATTEAVTLAYAADERDRPRVAMANEVGRASRARRFTWAAAVAGACLAIAAVVHFLPGGKNRPEATSATGPADTSTRSISDTKLAEATGYVRQLKSQYSGGTDASGVDLLLAHGTEASQFDEGVGQHGGVGQYGGVGQHGNIVDDMTDDGTEDATLLETSVLETPPWLRAAVSASRKRVDQAPSRPRNAEPLESRRG